MFGKKDPNAAKPDNSAAPAPAPAPGMGDMGGMY